MEHRGYRLANLLACAVFLTATPGWASDPVLEFACCLNPWSFENGAIVATSYADEQAYLRHNGRLFTGKIILRPGDTVSTAADGPRTEFVVKQVSQDGAELLMRQMTAPDLSEESKRKQQLRRMATKTMPGPQAAEPAVALAVNEKTFTLPTWREGEYIILIDPLIKVEGSNGQGWRTR